MVISHWKQGSLEEVQLFCRYVEVYSAQKSEIKVNDIRNCQPIPQCKLVGGFDKFLIFVLSENNDF